MSQDHLAPYDVEARIAVLEASIARANAVLAARDLLIETLRGQIARLRRMQFGASSEKLTREIAQLELALEVLETQSAVPGPARPCQTRPGDRHRSVRCPTNCHARNSFTSLPPAPAHAGLRRCATPLRARRL